MSTKVQTMSSYDQNQGKGEVLKRANPSTIQDKFMVGYQGWFTCGGDGEPVGPGHHGWLHWFDAPISDGGRANIDLWPDVSSYSPSELFPAPGLKTASGEQVFLFSSRHPKTVQRHFRWMAEHGVDGAFLQRFASQCDLESGNGEIRRIRDEVGDRVREAAEKEGRTFAIMYDVSGVPADDIQRVLQCDWIHLIRNQGVLDSPNYLREKGKAVVALWGFGFENAGHTPALVRAVTKYIRDVTPGGAYIMAGTPAHWRTATSDADRDPGFLDVWLNDFDAISPWTVGRYRDEKEADDFAETKMKGDVALIKKRNEEGCWRQIDYIPVVLPGGSGFNVSQGKWGFNDIKRNGGRFLWQQIFNAKRLGVRTMYGAMWDEYDEGTAFMPAIENKRMLPVSASHRFLSLDEDGYNVPSDWYMRICGLAAEGLRSERQIFETFPSKEVEDYWSSRPKYEAVDTKSGDFVSGASCVNKHAGTAGGGEGMSYRDWLAAQKEDKEEQPPPPYSLEAEGPSSEPSSVAHVSTAITHSATTPSVSSVARKDTTLTAGVDTSTQSQSYIGSTHQAIGPPPVNTGSRPQHRHGRHSISPHTSPGGYDQTSSTPDRINTYPTHALNNTPSAGGNVYDPVASLANEFSGHGLDPVDSRQTASPPLVHASRPSTVYHDRPGPLHSLAQLQATHTRLSSPTPPTRPPTSQGLWAPPEWGIKDDLRHQSPPPAKQSSYPGNLSMPSGPLPPRPHSAMSSVHPYFTTSGGTPTAGQQGGPLCGPVQTAYLIPGVPPIHGPDTSTHPLGGSPYPSTGGAPLFPQGPSDISSYSSNNTSANSSQIVSLPYSPSGYYPPASHNLGFEDPSHVSPPRSPVTETSYYPGQTTGHGFPVVQGSSYPGFTSYDGHSLPLYGPPHGMPNPQSDGPVQGGGFRIPHKLGGDSYFGNSQPQSSGYSPGYIGGSTPYSASSMMPSSSSRYPGSSSTSAAPPVHPGRSSTQSSYSSSAPWPSTASPGLLGSALSAVDRVAGKKTREQLESVAQSGTKLLHKLTK